MVDKVTRVIGTRDDPVQSKLAPGHHGNHGTTDAMSDVSSIQIIDIAEFTVVADSDAHATLGTIIYRNAGGAYAAAIGTAARRTLRG